MSGDDKQIPSLAVCFVRTLSSTCLLVTELVDLGESLSLARGHEIGPFTLARPGSLSRLLRPVTRSFSALCWMFGVAPQFLCSPPQVPELVGNQRARSTVLLSEQLAHEPTGRVPVAPAFRIAGIVLPRAPYHQTADWASLNGLGLAVDGHAPRLFGIASSATDSLSKAGEHSRSNASMHADVDHGDAEVRGFQLRD